MRYPQILEAVLKKIPNEPVGEGLRMDTPPDIRGEEDVGQYIRHLRRQKKMNLEALSELTGLSISTLSKLENNQIELTYAKLMLVSKGLGVNLSELIFKSGAGGVREASGARRSITRKAERVPFSSNNYEYGYLNTDLSKKAMVPVTARVKANTLEEFGPLAVHPGEEFIFVLSGSVEVHTEEYEMVVLDEGDAMYFDASMPHAILNAGRKEAEIIFLNTPNIRELSHIGGAAAVAPKLRRRSKP